ncbi:MAG: methylated-DNA--[protein]-cysteine S-methyltransferase [Legionella sp.]|nr:methylated-DNA--[protein]-cysteine S-methyltransferase [Legionella sp.]
MSSPVGPLTLIASELGLHAVLWERDSHVGILQTALAEVKCTKTKSIFMSTKQQITEYFLHKRQSFDLPLVLQGTDFQMQCWQQLLSIPYASTISYKEQALQLGDKNKARAVGMSNGLNPLSIVIPCHRVIGSSGKLVGFGGGLLCKEWLIHHEKKNLNSNDV